MSEAALEERVPASRVGPGMSSRQRYHGRKTVACLAAAVAVVGCTGSPDAAVPWVSLGVRLELVGRITAEEPLSAWHLLRAGRDSIVVFHETALSVMGSDGSVGRRIGAEGEGPGEFRQVTRVGRLSTGGVWAWDQRLLRQTLVRWTLHGAEVSSISLPNSEHLADGVLSWAGIIGDDGRGGRTGVGALTGTGGSGDTRAREETGVIGRVSAGRDGSRVVATIPRGTECSKRFGRVTVAIPECRRGRWAISPDGQRIVVAIPHEPDGPGGRTRFIHLDLSGDTLGVHDVDLPVDRFTQRMQDSVLAARRGGFPPELQAMEPSALQMPSWRTPMNHLLVGADGAIWVEGLLDAAGRAWALVGSSGRSLGVLVMEEDLLIADVSETGALAARDLADGSIEIYRISVQSP